MDWKQKYEELVLKHDTLSDQYHGLLIKNMEFDHMDGLLTNVCNMLDDELRVAKVFRNEGMECNVPDWGDHLKKLDSINKQLLNIWYGEECDESITITQFRPCRHKNGKIEKQTLDRHVQNISEIITFKCVDDYWFENELKRALQQKWLADSTFDNYIIGSWNSENLQRTAHSSDHHWREFKSQFHSLIGYNVFASRRQTSQIRKWTRSKSANVFSPLLERGNKKGLLTKYHLINSWQAEINDEVTRCHVYFMNDLEAISMCIDADINRNQFRIPQMIIENCPRTIVDSLTGDKQSVYGFCEGRASMTCMEKPMSADRTVPTVIVCGSFADNYHTHASIIHKMKSKFNFDKSYVVKALCSFPVVISLVLFNIDSKSKCIRSRFSSSSVVIWSKGMKQECCAGIENYNENIHTKCDNDIVKLKNEFISNIVKLPSKKSQSQNNKNQSKNQVYPKNPIPKSWEDALC